MNDVELERGFRVIRLGMLLLKKSDKTEFEERAAKSFKILMISTLIIVGIFVSVAGISIAGTFVSPFDPYSAIRTGTVKGTKVRYVQNTLKYITLGELGIDASSVKQGDEIRLYFDVQDRLKGAEPEANYEAKLYKLLITLSISTVVIIIFAILMKVTYGRPWYQWYKSFANRQDYLSNER